MPGTVEGGRKAAAKNKERYGLNFYKTIGKTGGQNGPGPFASDTDLAKRAGKLGGQASRRKSKKIILAGKGRAEDLLEQLNENDRLSKTLPLTVDLGLDQNSTLYNDTDY